MASASTPESAGRQPIAPATRRRLQQCFEHGSKSAAKGDFDYATNMFAQCVLGDPSNLIYAQQFLGNLYKKYNNNKKGSKFASMTAVGPRASLKKANMQKNWAEVMKAGLELLKLNPWDVSTLASMAGACDALGYEECQLVYLKSALDFNSKDADVNRLCGRALARQGQFDQAIACWHRVEQAKPGDQEAQKAIGDLAVNKTISQGGYEDASSSTEVMADKTAQSERQTGAAKLTPQQLLEKAIAKQPEVLSNYLELADLQNRGEHFADAEATLNKALQVSGGDLNVRERLEDVQLRRGRQQLDIAEKRSANEKTAEAADLLKRMKAELNRMEIDVYRSRAERYPTNVGLKFELGVRLKRAGQFNDAIQILQQARGDTKRKAAVHLELGECFQQIKQYKLALANYESAIEGISERELERELEQRKLALYRAGVLALFLANQARTAQAGDAQAGVKELDSAEKYLTELAGLDFGYKDVAERLDKIGRMRNKV